ncbi:glycosyltransferase family 2 protein [bacterium]|nr:glycosyltransferase family 2 protein [candidate division CSSED10-310 bacterium]
MNKLTVLIPCRNEERHIGACLESVRWADEILVVDSGSTDRTVEIARTYTDRILEHEYVNSAAQKNWAIPQAANEWVLIVDADERVTPELADEITRLLAGEPAANGYYIYRRNHFLGREIHHSGWQRDKVLRLFRKSVSLYPEKWVHADMIVDGPVAKLRNKLLHYTCEDLETYMKKWDRYTTWAGRDLVQRGRRIGAWRLVTRPAWRFFRQYILYRGFLDGLEGYLICRLAAMSVFVKHAKAWAEQREERS